MFQLLLSGQNFDYCALTLRDANPMLIERKICTVTEEKDSASTPLGLIVQVPDGPHPFKSEKGVSASAVHHIPYSQILKVSYYNELVAEKPLIQSPNGTKTGSRIIS